MMRAVVVVAVLAFAATAPARAAEIALPAATLRAGDPAATTVTAGRVDAVALRARARSCGRRTALVVAADGRRLARFARLSGRWARRRAPAHLAGGRHRVVLRLRAAPPPCTVSARGVRLSRPAPSAAGDLPLGAAARADLLAASPAYGDAIARRFDSITPENELKWEVVQPHEGDFRFEAADALVALASRHGKRVRGHTLVYHEQLPGWITRPLVPWTRERLLAVLERHVKTVVGRYRGRIQAWDVVNEPLAEDGSLRRSIWHEVIGPDYIGHALRYAHEAAPDATLYVNEIGAEHDGTKSRALASLAARLLAAGAPLHAIGVQGHVPASSGLTREELLRVLVRYGALGLRTAITELDVERDGPGHEDRQAAVAGVVASACAATAGCEGVTAWGVTDAHSWLGPEAEALLLDARFAPKPAYTVVRDQLSVGSAAVVAG
jgi:endo-1,4-beta-xylanase